MKSLKTKIWAVLIMMGISGLTQAQSIYSYTNNTSGSPASVDPNATGSSIVKKFGLGGLPDGCSDGYNTKKYSLSSTWTVTTTCIEFTIEPNFGYMVTATSMSADMRRTLSGPSQVVFAVSNDGNTWATNTAFTPSTNNTCGSTTTETWDMPDISSNSKIYVRIYGYAATSTAGRVQHLNITLNGSVVQQDDDGDGYGVLDDCNDANPAINPGATEVCNGIDDECDALVDAADPSVVGLITWYADADNDGYGNPASFIMSCGTIGGAVLNGDDCDDTQYLYADADGDGYGAGSPVACGVPSADDCNDADNTVNPAAAEICNGLDENCDGLADEGIDLSIYISPGLANLCAGETVEFAAPATFDSYKWYKNGNEIQGQTSSTLTASNPGYYQVEGFKDECTSGLSEIAIIDISPEPSNEVNTPDGTDLCALSNVKLKASNDPLYTHQWYKDGVAMAGETDNVHYATEPGDYYDVVTNSYGCTENTPTITVISSCKIGLGDAASLTVYPNPVNDVAYIQFNAATAGETLKIVSPTGEEMFTEILPETGSIQVNIGQQFANGVYLVQVTSANAAYTAKFTVNK